MRAILRCKPQEQICVLSLIFLLLFFLSAEAQADPYVYGFYNISGNNVLDAAIGEAQLSVDVTDAGGGQVLFTFSNAGPFDSSITDVYFDDGSLLGIAELIDSDENGGDLGVDFSELATPENLPAANLVNPVFETTTGFSADSDPPTQPWGVNPDETLGILFVLQGWGTFNSVISELSEGILRIGIHVQGYTSGGSESFLNNPDPGFTPTVVPLPGAAILGLLGLGAAGIKLRKFT